MLDYVQRGRFVSIALCLAGLIILSPIIKAAPASSITVVGEGSAKARPLTISRVFAQGDIADCAQAVIGGKAVETQCDVKTRWPDGSLQHAMLSFWLAAPGTVEVSFRNQPVPEEGGGLTASEMLSEKYEFSAVMELDNGFDVLRADAREMVSAGDFRPWLSGPICTQVIIEDRSKETKYDLGWDQHRPFHPIFVATFYPGWSGVKVEMIGEAAWTTRLQDLKYSLTLRTGTRSASNVVYQKPQFTHFARTRWRKVFWSGEAPPPVTLDLNFPYLIYSKVLPSYDLTKKLSAEHIRNVYNSFKGTDQGDVGGGAGWTKYFPTSGGRAEIGLFPSFYVDYLYTFDKRLHEVMLGYASASGSVPIHFRESDSDRAYLHGSRRGDAMGRPVSVDARPTVWLNDYRGTHPRDIVTALAPLADTGWYIDKAHQGSFAYIPYLVTGDWYFLEEMYFWASYSLAAADACDYPSGICRVGSLGYIPAVQLRGVAWALRNVTHAAFLAPDGTPEKAYFRNKVYNNIAVHEGFLNIKDGAFYRSPYTESPRSGWNYGRALGEMLGDNPLNFSPPTSDTPLNDVNSDVVSVVESPWAMNFMYVVLGHMEELGAPVTAWKERVYRNLLDRLTHPDFNPYLVAAYRIPVLNKEKVFFTDWRSVLQGYQSKFQNMSSWDASAGGTDPSNGYPFITLAAASFLPGMSYEGRSGDAAWAWVRDHVDTKLLNSDPKWALVPRSASEPPPATWPLPSVSEATGRRSRSAGR